jgi:ABC-type uncharacterized transport system permease subunit
MVNWLLAAATFVFLAGFGHTLYAIGAGRFRPGRLNLAAMTGGFALLSGELWQRGQATHGCPINSLFDVLVFMSWSIVLIYLIIGPAYRLSLLGTFTSGLVLFILLIAQLVPMERSTLSSVARRPWVEFHAALSLIAYGAFALAAVAGVMYLVQNRQLKRRKGGALLYNLPPVTDLAVANGRLLMLGFTLLTVSFVAGFVSGMTVNTVKFWASALIWAVYGGLLVLLKTHGISPRRTAVLSAAVFVMALLSLPAIQYLSIAR